MGPSNLIHVCVCGGGGVQPHESAVKNGFHLSLCFSVAMDLLSRGMVLHVWGSFARSGEGVREHMGMEPIEAYGLLCTGHYMWQSTWKYVVFILLYSFSTQ